MLTILCEGDGSESTVLPAARAFVQGLMLRHPFDCQVARRTLKGDENTFVDFFPQGTAFASHEQFGGIFVRVWQFGSPWRGAMPRG